MTKAPLTIEDVATLPFPGTAVPTNFTFAPDSNNIAYLYSEESSLVRQLFIHDPETGQRRQLVLPPNEGTTEETISHEEALRRERQRERGLGITSYHWHKNGQLLIPLKGGIYVQDGDSQPLRQLVSGEDGPCLTPRFSPDGNWIAFVRDAELYIVAADGGDPEQITEGARGTGKTHGLAEFVAQEEMARYMGFWWSPDSQSLAFQEVDETHIPIYRIVHQGKDSVGEGAQEDHRYPFAGQPNAKVRLGVVGRKGGDPVWMDLGADEDIYLARVNWLPDGRLTAQRLNRLQTQLDLLVFDPFIGKSTLLIQEQSDIWINIHNHFRPLRKSAEHGASFLWASERTGFMHLYLLDENGEVQRPLTSGDWMIDHVVGIDEANQTIYFTATRATPLESHLYAVGFDGGEPRQITTEPGMHNIIIDNQFERFIDVMSNGQQPYTITLNRTNDGELIHTLHQPNDPRLETLNLPAPQIVSLPTRDGVTLYGAIYKPEGDGPFPTIVSVYGGPHAQRVTNNWFPTINMRAQYLVQQGFLVFVLDNRGSARRGLAFESPLRHNMGDIEVQDQVDGVQWLIEQGLTDPQRVGMYGWSYGGYMTLMCLMRAADTFKVGVAGAPVTHWDGYDTCYTERYMGLPQTNPSGYETSSVLAHVDNLQGNLLLVHGMIDENVHFRHTARLVNALIKARKPYDLMMFPNERHSPRGLADRVYMEERIRDYFLTHLGVDGK